MKDLKSTKSRAKFFGMLELSAIRGGKLIDDPSRPPGVLCGCACCGTPDGGDGDADKIRDDNHALGI